MLFGDDNSFICKFQSFSIGTFIEARETFATSITIIMFIKAILKKNLNRDTTIKVVMLIGYCFPIINNICFILIGGYGKSHLFCFTNGSPQGKLSVTLHFSYIIINQLFSIILSTVLIIHICYFKKEKSKSNTTQKFDLNNNSYSTINSQNEIELSRIIKKIIFFPIAQFLFMLCPFIYRGQEWFSTTQREKSYWILFGGIVAIACSFPAIGYTLIFAVTNGMFSIICQERRKEKISDLSPDGLFNKTDSLTEMQIS